MQHFLTPEIMTCAFLIVGVVTAFLYGRGLATSRAQLTADSAGAHSLPSYHGYFSAWTVALLAIGVIALWVTFSGALPKFMFPTMMLGAIALGFIIINRLLTPTFRARNHVERFVGDALMICSGVAVLTTFGIVLSLVFESLRFFDQVPILDFLTGLNWSPQTALREDQIGQSGSFGAVPIFAGTFMITAVAIFIAGPIGLLIAVYLSEYANKRTRATVKPLVEILAGIPTIVYGFFALLTVGPAIRNFAEGFGLSVPTQSAIAAGSVMGVMIIPFISSLSDDVINAVPQTLRDGSLALGATKSETMTKVIFPAALPGIIGAFLLAVSRAIGETMIVVMAAGRAANLTGNPFEAVTTVTVQIVSLLTGDQEFDSAKTLAAFALGLVLFVFTLVLNVIALLIVRKYRERYE